MRRDPRPPVATLQRASRRHRDLCYVLTDRSDVDEFAVAIIRSERSATDAEASDRSVDIVNRGATSWPVIVDNVPVETLDSSWANAVPATLGHHARPGETGLDESGLRPNRVQWRVHRTSQYGTTMVDASVGLRWTFGTRHEGRGAYISRTWIEVPKCHVAWGVQLQLAAQVLHVRNVGSDHDPVAGIPVGIVGSITTPLGSESLDWRLAIRGDGSTTRWSSGRR